MSRKRDNTDLGSITDSPTIIAMDDTSADGSSDEYESIIAAAQRKRDPDKPRLLLDSKIVKHPKTELQQRFDELQDSPDRQARIHALLNPITERQKRDMRRRSEELEEQSRYRIDENNLTPAQRRYLQMTEGEEDEDMNGTKPKWSAQPQLRAQETGREYQLANWTDILTQGQNPKRSSSADSPTGHQRQRLPETPPPNKRQNTGINKMPKAVEAISITAKAISGEPPTNIHPYYAPGPFKTIIVNPRPPLPGHKYSKELRPDEFKYKAVDPEGRPILDAQGEQVYVKQNLEREPIEFSPMWPAAPVKAVTFDTRPRVMDPVTGKQKILGKEVPMTYPFFPTVERFGDEDDTAIKKIDSRMTDYDRYRTEKDRQKPTVSLLDGSIIHESQPSTMHIPGMELPRPAPRVNQSKDQTPVNKTEFRMPEYDPKAPSPFDFNNSKRIYTTSP